MAGRRVYTEVDQLDNEYDMYDINGEECHDVRIEDISGDE